VHPERFDSLDHVVDLLLGHTVFLKSKSPRYFHDTVQHAKEIPTRTPDRSRGGEIRCSPTMHPPAGDADLAKRFGVSGPAI